MAKKDEAILTKPVRIGSGVKTGKRNGKAVQNATSKTLLPLDAAAYIPKPISTTGKPSRSAAGGYYYGVIILKGVASKRESLMTAIEKMEMVRIGVSKNDLENLKDIAALDYDKLAKGLSVTRATLINKKGKDKFSSSLSERIIGLADIYSYGYSVLEDEGQFNKWMFRPNKALAGKAPYDLIDNQFGREEVRSIIGRIEYGVYS